MKEQPGEQWPATRNIHLELLLTAAVRSAALGNRISHVTCWNLTVDPLSAGVCEIERLRPGTHVVEHRGAIRRYQSLLTNRWGLKWSEQLRLHPPQLFLQCSNATDIGQQKWASLWKKHLELFFHPPRLSSSLCLSFFFPFFLSLFFPLCTYLNLSLCGCWWIFWEPRLVGAGCTKHVWSSASK